MESKENTTSTQAKQPIINYKDFDFDIDSLSYLEWFCLLLSYVEFKNFQSNTSTNIKKTHISRDDTVHLKIILVNKHNFN